jgi:hypothetical protein
MLKLYNNMEVVYFSRDRNSVPFSKKKLTNEAV